MPDHIPLLVIVMVAIMILMAVINMVSHMYNLNGIKSKTVGDGQHGTSRWATTPEIKRMYRFIKFTPKKWREQAKNGESPTIERMPSLRLKIRNKIRVRKVFLKSSSQLRKFLRALWSVAPTAMRQSWIREMSTH